MGIRILPSISSFPLPETYVNVTSSGGEAALVQRDLTVVPLLAPRSTPPAPLVARRFASTSEQDHLREFTRERLSFINEHLQARDKQEAFLLLLPSLVELGDEAKITEILQSFSADLQNLPLPQQLQIRRQLAAALQGSRFSDEVLQTSVEQINQILAHPDLDISRRAQELIAATQIISQNSVPQNIQTQVIGQLLDLRAELYPLSVETPPNAEAAFAFLQIDHFISQNPALRERLENNTLAQIDFWTARSATESQVPAHEKGLGDLAREIAEASFHTLISRGAWLRNHLTPEQAERLKQRALNSLSDQRRRVTEQAFTQIDPQHISLEQLRTLAFFQADLSIENRQVLRQTARSFAQNSLNRTLFRQEFHELSDQNYARLSEQVVDDFESYLFSSDTAAHAQERLAQLDTVSVDSLFRQALIGHQMVPNTRPNTCWSARSFDQASQALQIFSSLGLKDAVRSLGRQIFDQLDNRTPSLAYARRYRELAQMYSRAGLQEEALQSLNALAVMCPRASNASGRNLSAADRASLQDFAQLMPVFQMETRELTPDRLDQISTRLEAIISNPLDPNHQNSMAIEMKTQIDSQRATLRSATLLRVLDAALNHQINVLAGQGAASNENLFREKDLFIQEIQRLTSSESENRLTVAQAIQTLLGSDREHRFPHLQEFFAAPTGEAQTNIEESVNGWLGNEDTSSAASMGQLVLNFANANSNENISASQMTTHIEGLAWNLSHSRFNSADVSLSLCELLKERGVSAAHVAGLETDFKERAQLNGVLASAQEMIPHLSEEGLPLLSEETAWNYSSFLIPFMFGGLASARVGASLGRRLLCTLGMKVVEAMVFEGLGKAIGGARAYVQSQSDTAHHALAFQNWRQELSIYNLTKEYLGTLTMFLACHHYGDLVGQGFIKPTRTAVVRWVDKTTFSSGINFLNRQGFSTFMQRRIVGLSEAGLGGVNFVGSNLGGFVVADRVQADVGLREREEISSWNQLKIKFFGNAIEAAKMDIGGRAISHVPMLGALKHDLEARHQVLCRLPAYGEVFNQLRVDPTTEQGGRILSVLHSIESPVADYRAHLHLDLQAELSPHEAARILSERVKAIDTIFSNASRDTLHESLSKRTRRIAEALEYGMRGHSVESLLKSLNTLDLDEKSYNRLLHRSFNFGLTPQVFELAGRFTQDLAAAERSALTAQLLKPLIQGVDLFTFKPSQLKKVEALMGRLTVLEHLHDHLEARHKERGISYRESARSISRADLLRHSLSKELSLGDLERWNRRMEAREGSLERRGDELVFVEISKPATHAADSVIAAKRIEESPVTSTAGRGSVETSERPAGSLTPQSSVRDDNAASITTARKSRARAVLASAQKFAKQAVIGAAAVVGAFGFTHLIQPGVAHADPFTTQQLNTGINFEAIQTPFLALTGLAALAAGLSFGFVKLARTRTQRARELLKLSEKIKKAHESNGLLVHLLGRVSGLSDNTYFPLETLSRIRNLHKDLSYEIAALNFDQKKVEALDNQLSEAIDLYLKKTEKKIPSLLLPDRIESLVGGFDHNLQIQSHLNPEFAEQMRSLRLDRIYALYFEALQSMLPAGKLQLEAQKVRDAYKFEIDAYQEPHLVFLKRTLVNFLKAPGAAVLASAAFHLDIGIGLEWTLASVFGQLLPVFKPKAAAVLLGVGALLSTAVTHGESLQHSLAGVAIAGIAGFVRAKQVQHRLDDASGMYRWEHIKSPSQRTDVTVQERSAEEYARVIDAENKIRPKKGDATWHSYSKEYSKTDAFPDKFVWAANSDKSVSNFFRKFNEYGLAYIFDAARLQQVVERIGTHLPLFGLAELLHYPLLEKLRVAFKMEMDRFDMQQGGDTWQNFFTRPLKSLTTSVGKAFADGTLDMVIRGLKSDLAAQKVRFKAKGPGGTDVIFNLKRALGRAWDEFRDDESVTYIAQYLSPRDLHCTYGPFEGVVEDIELIDGPLHTVMPPHRNTPEVSTYSDNATGADFPAQHKRVVMKLRDKQGRVMIIGFVAATMVSDTRLTARIGDKVSLKKVLQEYRYGSYNFIAFRSSDFALARNLKLGVPGSDKAEDQPAIGNRYTGEVLTGTTDLFVPLSPTVASAVIDYEAVAAVAAPLAAVQSSPPEPDSSTAKGRADLSDQHPRIAPIAGSNTPSQSGPRRTLAAAIAVLGVTTATRAALGDDFSHPASTASHHPWGMLAGVVAFVVGVAGLTWRFGSRRSPSEIPLLGGDIAAPTSSVPPVEIPAPENIAGRDIHFVCTVINEYTQTTIKRMTMANHWRLAEGKEHGVYFWMNKQERHFITFYPPRTSSLAEPFVKIGRDEQGVYFQQAGLDADGVAYPRQSIEFHAGEKQAVVNLGGDGFKFALTFDLQDSAAVAIRPAASPSVPPTIPISKPPPGERVSTAPRERLQVALFGTIEVNTIHEQLRAFLLENASRSVNPPSVEVNERLKRANTLQELEEVEAELFGALEISEPVPPAPRRQTRTTSMAAGVEVIYSRYEVDAGARRATAEDGPISIVHGPDGRMTVKSLKSLLLTLGLGTLSTLASERLVTYAAEAFPDLAAAGAHFLYGVNGVQEAGMPLAILYAFAAFFIPQSARSALVKISPRLGALASEEKLFTALFQSVGEKTNAGDAIPALIPSYQPAQSAAIQAPNNVQQLEVMMRAAKIPAQSLAFLRGRLEVLARIPDKASREIAMSHFMSMVHRIEAQGRNSKLNEVLTQTPSVHYAELNAKAKKLNGLLETSSNGLGRDLSEWAMASRVLNELKTLGDSAKIDEALARLDFFPAEQRQAMAENPHDLTYQDYLLVLSEPGLRDEPATQQLIAAVERFYDNLEILRNSKQARKESVKEKPLDDFDKYLGKLEAPNHSAPPQGIDYKAELVHFQNAMQSFLEENPILGQRLQIAKSELTLLRKALLSMPASQVAEKLSVLKNEIDSFEVRRQRAKTKEDIRTVLRRNINSLEVHAKKIEKARRKNRTDVAAQGEYEQLLEKIIESVDFSFWTSFSELANTAQLQEVEAALADYAAEKVSLLEKAKPDFDSAQAANDAFHGEHDAFKQQVFADDLQLQLFQIQGYLASISEAEKEKIQAKITRYDALLARLRQLPYGQGKADGLTYNRLLEAALKALKEIRSDVAELLSEDITAVSLLSAPYVDKLSKLQSMGRSLAEKGRIYQESFATVWPLLKAIYPLIPVISNAETHAASPRTYYKLAQARLPEIFEATGVTYRGTPDVEHILSREHSIHSMKHSSWWDFLSLAVYIVHMMRGKVGPILGKEGLMDMLPGPIARVLSPYMVPVGSKPHEYDTAINRVVNLAAEGYPATVYDELTMPVVAEPLGFLGLLPYPPLSLVSSLPQGGRSLIIAKRQMARTGRMPLHEISNPLGSWSRMPKPDNFYIQHPAQVITESVLVPSLALGSASTHEAAQNSAANWIRTFWLRMGLNPKGWPSLDQTSHAHQIVNHRAASRDEAVEAHLRTLSFYPTEARVEAERVSLEALRVRQSEGSVSLEELALAEQAFEATLTLQKQLQAKEIVLAASKGSGTHLRNILSGLGLGSVLMLQGCKSELPIVAGVAALLGLAIARFRFSSNEKNIKVENKANPIGQILHADELPESLQSWAGVRGSGFVSHEKVADSKELAQAIVKNLRNTLGDNVTQITGYGSFSLFSKGKNEAIHLRDADKKPDFILVVRDTNEAMECLGKKWNWSAEKIAEMQEHARFSPWGDHQGFTYFNSDILIPELGLTGFKFSLISEEAFYACDQKGRPNLEYAQIRLKDHNPVFALLHSSDRENFINHLQKIRVAMCEDALIHLDKHKSFTGKELGVEFFNASYRREGYRFWEWTKGADLFESRHELTAALLVDAYRVIAEKYSLTLLIPKTKIFEQRAISAAEINAANIYDVIFTKTKVLDLPRMSSSEYLRFLSRGFWSYIKHGLPGNRIGGAFYVQSNAQYAGRKYRGKLKDQRTGQYYTKLGLMRDGKNLVQGWLLANPLFKSLPGLGPIMKLVALDTWRVPVYYPDMEVFINELHANAESPLHLDSAEHAYLSRFFASDPKLLQRQNAALLMPLVQMISEQEGFARSAAIKLLTHIGTILPLQEASIRSLVELVEPRKLSVALVAENAADQLKTQAELVYPSPEFIRGYEIKTAEQTDAVERRTWQKALDFCTSQRLSLRLLELDSRLKQELSPQNILKPEIRKSLRRFQRIVQSNQKLLVSVREKLNRNKTLNLAEKSFLNKAGAVFAGRQNIEGRDHILEQLDWYFRTQDQGSDFNRGLVEKQNAYYTLIEQWNERRKDPANPESQQLHVSEDPRHEQLYNEYRISIETLLNLNGILPDDFHGDLFRDITFRREGETTVVEPRGWVPSKEFSLRRLWHFFVDDTKRGSAIACFKLFDLVSKEDHQRLYNMVHSSWLYRAMARTQTKVVLHDTQNLTQATRPAVILPTHDSGLEFSAVLGILHDYDYFAYYMADEKFLRPPISWLLRGMKELGHFFVNRKDRAEALKSMIATGAEVGTTKKSSIIFPGATRNPIRYSPTGERVEGPMYGAKPGALATLDAANKNRPTLGILMGLVGGGIIYSKESFRSLWKGAAVGREYHVHFGEPIRPENLKGPNGETTADARRKAFTSEIDRQFHKMTGRAIAPPAQSKDKKAKKGGGGNTPPSAAISGLSVLAMGAMGTFLTTFTNTESLALKAVSLGIFVSVAGKEVCDRFLWPRLRQKFIDRAQAKGVDVSQINVSGKALASLSEILRQGKIDFKNNPKILIPNSLTASAIVSALGACAASIAHRPLLTVLGLGLAPFLDGIDGKVARSLKASSRTGALADDFADNLNNGAVVGTLVFAHLANLGHSVYGVMAASAFTLAIRLRLSLFRLTSDNRQLTPEVDPLGNRHYKPKIMPDGTEIPTGFLGVASPVAAMSVLGLYSSVQNSPNLFFGGCMLTAYSLIDWMARGKIGSAGLTAKRAAAYSLPGMFLSAYHLMTDTPMTVLPGTIDVLSGGVASFTTAYMVEPYVAALRRKLFSSRSSGDGLTEDDARKPSRPLGGLGE